MPNVKRIAPQRWGGVADGTPVFGDNKKFTDYRRVRISSFYFNLMYRFCLKLDTKSK